MGFYKLANLYKTSFLFKSLTASIEGCSHAFMTFHACQLFMQMLQLGSGTDPVEGGCLAAVLLEWLLTRARLTFCTSHHADLKELAVSACIC